MLEELMRYVNNWFVVRKYSDEFTIENGAINLDFLQNDQYFRIVGSIFNDGVYKYGDTSPLTDETFTGEIWALAVPKAFIELAENIKNWNDKYEEQANSPYSSESFGGYSYSKGTASADGEGGSSWRSVFKSELNKWRKI